MLFWTVSSVVEPGRAGENVHRSACSFAGQRGCRGHGKDVGTGRVHESRDQGDVSNESDISGHRTESARRVRVFRLQGPGRSKYIIHNNNYN